MNNPDLNGRNGILAFKQIELSIRKTKTNKDLEERKCEPLHNNDKLLQSNRPSLDIELAMISDEDAV